MQKGKWLSDDALQIAEERREGKGKKERKRYSQLNSNLQKRDMNDKKDFKVANAKKYEKITEWVKLEICSRKLEISREHFMQRWAL